MDMGQLRDILETMTQNSGQNPNTEPFYNDNEQYFRMQSELYNKKAGTLEGYDCPVCRNKGNIMYYDPETGYTKAKECECMAVRRSQIRIEHSGLKGLLDDYTFDTFTANQPWQKQFKDMALAFTKDYSGKWFFAGGQPGCGKTHLCTAIVGELMKQGKPAKYMMWRDEIVKLKAVINDNEAYSDLIRDPKTLDVLYIDDLFKTGKDKDGKVIPPTPPEISIAFEILNYRYKNPHLITIISSERLIDDIIDIDEGIGSRIFQLAKKYSMIINYDRTRNYRFTSG